MKILLKNHAKFINMNKIKIVFVKNLCQKLYEITNSNNFVKFYSIYIRKIHYLENYIFMNILNKNF